MSWTQITPAHFQRPLGENETFIKMIEDSGHYLGHEHWAINADATFYQSALEPDIVMKRLENAWKTLRFDHPSIAAVASSTCLDYHIPNESALNQWSSETFKIHNTVNPADVVAHSKPTASAMLHVFPHQHDENSYEIVLHTSHWRSDGIGILQLFNAFFELVANDNLLNPAGLPWGQEISRLAPSVEQAANIPVESNTRIRAEAEKWTKTFHEADGAVGIHCSANKEQLPGGTRSARTSFSEIVTESISKPCKRRQISVTSAVHAALAQTNWSFAAPGEQSRHYTSTIRVALRPYLPEPYCTPAFAAGLYTSGYMYSLPFGQSFNDNAEEPDALYKLRLSRDFIEAHRQYALNLQELIRNAPAYSRSTEVDISSVEKLDGVMRHSYGPIEVTRISVGVETITRQMTCFVWTFRGKLSLNLVYNEAFYEVKTPIDFLEKLEKTLLEELGLDP